MMKWLVYAMWGGYALLYIAALHYAACDLVTWRAGRWVAQICVQGQGMYLGRFDTKEMAAKAYDDAAIEHFGEFALPNRAIHA